MTPQLLAAALTLVASGAATAALTPTGTPCSNTDVFIGAVSASDCIGYFEGNANAGGGPIFDDASAAIIGAWGPGLTIAALGQQNTGTQATFGALAGDVVVGVHWGGGAGGGASGFYRFDNLAATSAAVDPKDFFFADDKGGLSNVALYARGDVPPVPEPGAYALALVGLGILGVAARRRRAA